MIDQADLQGQTTESSAAPPAPGATGRRTWRTWQLVVSSLVALLVGAGLGSASGGDDEVRAGRDVNSASTPTTAPNVEEAAEVTTTAPPTTTTTAEPVKAGSRSNPLPVGQTAILSGDDGDEWAIKVVGFTPDASAAVMAENSFNDPPAPGRQFAMVRLEATYIGSQEPQALFTGVTFKALDRSNVTYDVDDSCGVVPEELDSMGDVYKGGVIVGHECWSVTSEHIDSLVLVVEPAFAWDSEPYFMAVR